MRGLFVLAICLLLFVCATQALTDTDFRDGLGTARNQGSCGACYGFALTAGYEWHLHNLTGISTQLSVQFYVDCTQDSKGNAIYGCSGGVLMNGMKLTMQYQYHPYDQDYPFTAMWDPDLCTSLGIQDRTARNALADVWLYDVEVMYPSSDGLVQGLEDNGPLVHAFYIDSVKWNAWSSNQSPLEDGCMDGSEAHAVLNVGWQSNNNNPYFILRNSYGATWGDEGYMHYADTESNREGCILTGNAFALKFGIRKELQYMTGEGMLNFYQARSWCQSRTEDETGNTRGGWDLAVIPTKMHNDEVFELIGNKWGSNKAKQDKYNWHWIGIQVDNTWVDNTEAHFSNWESKIGTFKHAGAMERFERRSLNFGKWSAKSKWRELRFVCSRYRAEHCPRISQTALENAYSLAFLDTYTGAATLEIDAGTTAEVVCMDGFQLQGNSQISCQESGMWSELPSCV